METGINIKNSPSEDIMKKISNDIIESLNCNKYKKSRSKIEYENKKMLNKSHEVDKLQKEGNLKV